MSDNPTLLSKIHRLKNSVLKDSISPRLLGSILEEMLGYSGGASLPEYNPDEDNDVFGLSFLKDLDDVGISDLVPGQSLVYTGTKWTNQSLSQGLDTSELETFLKTNDYAKKSDFPSLSDYAKKNEIPSLADYATRQWVQQQGYLTDADFSETYLTQSAFNDLFEKVNVGTSSAPVYVIKAKYGLYSVGEITAYGSGLGDSAPSGSTLLSELNDVELTLPLASGQALVYNGTNWVNQIVSGGIDASVLLDYAKKNDIPSLTGYAKEQWVIDKHYLTESAFNELFEKVNVGTSSAPVYAIKAKYGFYSVGEITAYGSGEDISSGEAGFGFGLMRTWDNAQKDNGSTTDALGANLGWELKQAIDNLPTTSVNPYALTIQRNGTTLGTYDGSESKTINISDVASASALSGHTSDTTIHITANERTLWNNTATNLSAILGADSDTIINKWEEVVAFLDTYTEADTLANLLGNKADKTTKISAGTGLSGGGTLTSDRTLSLATSGVTAGTYTKLTVDAYGRATSGASLVASDIPTLAISKISGLQTALNAKLDASVFNDMFELVTKNGVSAIKAKYGFYSVGEVTAYGSGDEASSDGEAPGFGLLKIWTQPSAGNDNDAFSASAVWNALGAIPAKVSALEEKNYLDNLSLTVSGSGNAVTAVTHSSDKKSITFVKGSTFLTSHQSLSAYLKSADAAATYLSKSDAAASYQPVGTYLSEHQPIFKLSFAAGAFSAKTYTPNSAAQTVSIPTTTSHISEGSRLYFTDARAQAALAATVSLLESAIAGKVDKADGYSLSKNDFSDALLTKLNGIESGANNYVHPSATAKTLAAASGKVISAITVSSLGHVTSVANKSLAQADIPALAISKVTNLQTSLDSKLDKSVFEGMFELVVNGNSTYIRAKHGFVSVGEVTGYASDGYAGASGNAAAASLFALSDVLISNPAVGQALIFNGSDWVNQSIPAASASPFALTVQKNGANVAVYDGSSAKTANITVGWSDTASGRPSWIGSSKPSYNFSEIGSKPTTIAGYGISDAKIANGVITLGSNTITPLMASNMKTLTFAAGAFSAKTYTPNSAAVTVNVPQKLTHLTNNLFVIGTQTAATNLWTGNVDGLTAYYDGLTIDYYLPFAGNSTAATLNLNGLGAKPMYNGRKGNITTHYVAGSVVRLTYYNGYFYADAYYDSNSTYSGFVSAYCSTAAGTAAKAASASNFALTAGVTILVRFTAANTVSGALTLNVNSTGAKPLYINGTVSSASNHTLAAGTYPCYYDGTNWYVYTDATYRFTNILADKIAKVGGTSSQFLKADGSVDSNKYLTGITKAQVEAVLTGNITSHTHSYLPLSGGTLTGDLLFANSGTTTRQMRFMVGTNDYGRIAAGATAANAGWMEIATADDGNEPVYARQYTGTFTSIKRTATLLDASGNTEFPGTLTASSIIKKDGTSAQFLKADGSVDSNSYALASGLTNGSVTKVGTATVGGTSKPIYLNAGAPTALSATVGGSAKPMYLNAGNMTALSATVGGTAKPMYLNAGTMTALSATVGSASKPVYLNGGTVTACTNTIPTNTNQLTNGAGFITAAALSSYLPLAGGTLTGVLATIENEYTDSYDSGAINLNNSDIFKVNSIKFADLCESASEGLQWFRDATHVDSLWVKSGVIYFTPNRAWGATATDHVVLHSNNYTSYVAKVGTATKGSASLPVYLNAGTPTACTASSVFSALAMSGNNLSVTVAGQNRTLTVGYATKAAQLNTARTLWGQSFNGTGNVDGTMTVNHPDWIAINLKRTLSGPYGCAIGCTTGAGTFLGAFGFDGGGFFSVTNASDTTLLCIRQNGNVGIGTTAPAYKLDVNGSAHVNGTISGCTRIYNASTANLYLGKSDNSGWVYTQDICSHNGSGNWFILASGNAYFKKVQANTETNSYALNCASFICDSWIRTTGQTGWYNETYGGGWYMTDTTWIRTYNGKSIYTPGTIQADSAVRAGSIKLHLTDEINRYGGDLYIQNRGNGDGGYGTTGDLLMCRRGGAVRIGSQDFNSNIIHYGNFVTSGEVTGFTSSDRRLKNNIRPISKAADIIRRLRPVQFNWNKKAVELNSAKDTQRTNYGLIAQEVEHVLPDIVHEIYGEYMSVDYEQVIPILVMMCQELSRENSRLRQRIDRIERR